MKLTEKVYLLTLLFLLCQSGLTLEGGVEPTKGIGHYAKTLCNMIALVPQTIRAVISQREYASFKRYFDTVAQESLFHLVDDVLPFTDYTYVGTHNAYAYKERYSVYPQHWVTIKEQLAFGVRGFMVDTYDHNKEVVLAHHSTSGPIAIGQTGFFSPKIETLKEVLGLFVEFLRAHPEEIVVVYIENHADFINVQKAIHDVEGLQEVLFKRDDFRADTSSRWPSIGWMRKHNKRLLLFIDTYIPSTMKELWYKKEYNVENQHGTVDKYELSKQVVGSSFGENDHRELLIFNHFRRITGISKEVEQDNSYKQVKEVTSFCQNEGLAGGKAFNGYFGDRIIYSALKQREKGEKTVFDLVNEINKADTE